MLPPIRFAFSFLILGIYAASALASTTSTGRTVGHFAVSPMGSAQYSIPLWNPPGIRGIQPRLALAYDSRLGYGIMGPGWTLTGLSTISRCNPTYAQDGIPAPITLTTADGFCLDGNRLRTTSTGVYQTEIANFSQVTASGTAGNGPSYFTVQGKDGLTYEYGNTTDSKIIPSGGATPYVWALDKVTDRAGNQMTFTYFQSGGAYVPLSIQYTAPSGSTSFPYQIKFGYTTKSANDALTTFIAGTQVQQTEQLQTITVTSSGTTVREYYLSYVTSTTTLRATLYAIQECGGSSGNDCLLPTTVGYQQGTAGVASPTNSSGSGATNGAVYSVDIDGDGRQDLVFATTSGSNYSWWVQLATASGYGSPISTGATSVGTTNFLIDNFTSTSAAQIMVPVSGYWVVYAWNGNSFTATSTGLAVTSTGTYCSADVDGDGRPDLVNVALSSTMGTFNFAIQLNTTTSGTVSFVATPVQQSTYVANATFSNLQSYGNNQLQTSSVKHFDFDGDGRQDLLLYSFMYLILPNGEPEAQYTLVAMSSRGTNAPVPTAEIGAGLTTNAPFMAVNWNDDACTDLIQGNQLIINQCNGSSGSFISLPAAPSVALDWDGDGRTDALADVNGTWEVYRSEGNTTAPGVSTGIPVVGTGAYIAIDKDGDGLPDLAYSNSTASNAIYYGLHNGPFTRPDLATSFVDGFGNGVYPVYAALTQPSTAYTATNDLSFPNQNYIGPLYVTWQVAFTDPSKTSGEYAWDFDYEGAALNLQGRGFVGFGVVQKFDTRTALFESAGYSRAFPTIGMRTYDIIFTDSNGAQTVTDTSATLASTTLDNTANNQRYFPYTSSTLKSEYEVGGSENGQLSKTTASTYTFDNYGNATTIATTITDDDSNSPYYGDQYVSTVVSTIAPNVGDWCLNLPTQTTVTNSSQAPGGAAITRTVQYTPDYVNCRETAKITEPGSSTYKVTETFGFDSFGNLNSDAVLGTGMTTRTTQINWGTNGQFPTAITNPLSQTIMLGFDPKTGMKTSQSDLNYTSSNPIQTTWTYDDFGRKTQETRPDQTYTTWQYNNCANNGGCFFGANALEIVATVYNVGGGIQSQGTTYYDTVDRTLISTAPLLSGSSRNEVRYDSVGRIAQQAIPCAYSAVTTPCPYWNTFQFDVRNRPTQSQRPISAAKSTQYQTTYFGYVGRTSTVEDALTNTTTKITTVMGNLARSQDAKGYYQNFTYDSFGALKQVTDSASNMLFSANYAYGLRAFQTSSSDMDLGARSYTIDALGEVTAYLDAKSQNFSMTYDALSRLKVRTEPDLTTTWTWGATASQYNIGRLQSVTAASTVGTYSEAFGYDSKTRLVTDTKTLPGDTGYTYTWTYNATTGLLNSVQYPVSTSSYQLQLEYGYTNGLLSSITDAQAGTAYWTANNTTPQGQVTKETLGNGVVTNRVFDAVTGWVSSIQSGVSSGSALQNNSFMYDELGDVTQRQDNNQGLTENLYYDTEYRLDHSTLNGTTNLQMTYDSGGAGPGNITARSDVAGGTAWTYDSVRKHAVTQAGTGGYAYSYDDNGNAQMRNGYTLAWTSYNYPSAVNTSSESALFQYGPDRQRWKTTYTGSVGTETTYHVGKLLEKVVNGSAIDYRHYIFAGSELVGIYSRQSSGTNTMHYVLGDHQGSFSSIVSSTGTPTVSESFTAYGNRRSGETWSGAPTAGDENTINGISRQGYTGQTALGVSMGLNHMNGRIEDAVTGRFLSPDPTIPNPGNTQSYNRYSYVNNNPLSLVDPTGFDDQPAISPVIVNGNVNSPPPGGGGTAPGDGFYLDIGSTNVLSKYQQQLITAGLSSVKNLRGLPSAAQTSADSAMCFALNANTATQGPQVAGASDDSGTNPSSSQSVVGDINKPADTGSNGTSPDSAQSQNSGGLLPEVTVTGTRDSALNNPYFFDPSFAQPVNGAQFIAQNGSPINRGGQQALTGRQLMGYGAAGGAVVGAGTVGGYAAVVGAQVGGAEIAELGLVYGTIGFGDAVAGYTMAGVTVGGAYGMVVGAGVGVLVYGITVAPPAQGPPPGMQNFLPY